MEENNKCEICYRIACRKCDWVATEAEVVEVQQGVLTECPVCGWSP